MPQPTEQRYRGFILKKTKFRFHLALFAFFVRKKELLVKEMKTLQPIKYSWRRIVNKTSHVYINKLPFNSKGESNRENEQVGVGH